MEAKVLPYEIHKYSSFSATYLPENIREDFPTNQTSRWSSNTNSPVQYLTLKLQRPAILKKIKFGKYEKTHVCNLRKLKIYGGLEEDHMVLLFEGGLRNDSIPETFDIRHTTNSGDLLPVRYVQIVPLLSWGPSFNFSIWFVELLGSDDHMFVLTSLRNYNVAREIEIVRLCLKHLRQRGYEKAFSALESETCIQLEDTTMTTLHKTLVIEGDFKKTESLMEDFINDGLMDSYISEQKYKAKWMLQDGDKQLSAVGAEDKNLRPGPRGGHQLVLDPVNSVIYLYAGWNGCDDLSDLWAYSIKDNKWELIHERSELINGPDPRACHKMVFDSEQGQIFMLGRYSPSKNKDSIKSDFYLFDTNTRNWFIISDDTSLENGPGLIYDHQMCIDAERRTIYVFGGKSSNLKASDDSNDMQYSGLYSYHIGTNTWQLLLVDCAHPTAANPEVQSIKSRATHSMLFHNKQRKLYIFGGQRGKEYITDFLAVDVDTCEVSTIQFTANQNQSAEGGYGSEMSKSFPSSGFTQRSTIDCERNEIYVLTSLSKDKERRDLNINSFWMFSLKTNEWVCIYKSDHHDNSGSLKAVSTTEPCPRYAHQLIYDGANKIHYLFGGNPGGNSQIRLDDFWMLKLNKPSRENISNQCKYLIRKQEYEEIAKTDAIRAVSYLQTKLHETIDQKDKAQVNEFHKLASLLFQSNISDRLGVTVEEQELVGLDELIVEEDDFHHANFMSANPNEKIGTVISPTISDMSTDDSCSSSTLSTTTTGYKHSGQNAQNFKYKFHKESKKSLEIRSQRCILFNKLIELIPDTFTQPKGNLSDFVLI